MVSQRGGAERRKRESFSLSALVPPPLFPFSISPPCCRPLKVPSTVRWGVMGCDGVQEAAVSSTYDTLGMHQELSPTESGSSARMKS